MQMKQETNKRLHARVQMSEGERSGAVLRQTGTIRLL